MLKLIKIAGLIWCGIFMSLSCYGQGIRKNIPLGAMPMQYNPSFAGEAGAGRFSSSSGYYKLLSPTSPRSGDDHNFSFYKSYDQFVPALASGIGITAGYEGARNYIFNGNVNFFSLAVAPKISIKGKYTLSPSLDIGYHSSRLEFKDFPGLSVRKEEIPDKVNILSSKAGLLFNTNKYYISYSAYLLNRHTYHGPNGILESPFSRVGFRSYLQFGYTFQRSAESKFSFTPQFAFSFSEKMHPDDDIVGFEGLNLNFRYTKYIGGINNSGVHLGYQNEKLRLMLSKSINGFIGEPGSVNLSFRYIFKDADKNQNWY